uniref:Uncharacterized protein n=1 Tax=Arundo donax TaxID=35708 RepID=A0A0A9BF46_ARUDO
MRNWKSILWRNLTVKFIMSSSSSVQLTVSVMTGSRRGGGRLLLSSHSAWT